MEPSVFLYIYLVQVLIIFILGYAALEKGSTAYDLITFKNFEYYYIIPAWVLAIPGLGTIMVVLCLLGILLTFCIVLGEYLSKNSSKKLKNIKIK